MGSKAPLFLLLLMLLVSSVPAQAKDADHSPVNKEQISTTKVPVHLKSSSPVCSACEKFAKEAVSYLSEKQTQDKIMEFLHNACSQSFSLEQKCVELMDSYATLLFSKIVEIKPEEFCKQYGLCRDMSLFAGVRSDSTCVFCHHLLDEIMSKLKDPDAEFEIIQILIKECNKIEGHVQQVSYQAVFNIRSRFLLVQLLGPVRCALSCHIVAQLNSGHQNVLSWSKERRYQSRFWPIVTCSSSACSSNPQASSPTRSM